MSALEIRLIAYTLAALFTIGGTAWAVHTLDAHHYERLAAADKHAQDVALQAAQQKAIDDLKAQQAVVQAAEKQNADLKASYSGLAARLVDSVRNYASLRGLLVSQTASAASKPDAASQGAGSNRGLAELSGSAAGACLEDAAELTALQTWARGAPITP